jgi:hypothetical protein
MRPRRTPPDLVISLGLIVVLLGAVLTRGLLTVVDASEASGVMHDLVAEGGAGITAFAGVVLNELCSPFWDP